MKKNFRLAVITFFVLLVCITNMAGQQRGSFSIQDAKINLSQQATDKHQLKLNKTTACSYDSLVFTRQSQIDSFPVTNPGCTQLRLLTIDGAGASPAITNLDSLYSITSITEHLTVRSTAVTTLGGLSSLTSVGVFLWVNDNPQLTTIGLNNMTQIGLIIIYGDTSLTSLGPLTHNLVNKNLGTLIISNTRLANLAGLDSIQSLPNMYISGNPHLTTLQGLNNLASCDGGVSIYYNPVLSNMTALGKLTNVSNGTLECSYNYQLTNLTGLHNINHIGGGLWLSGNNNLISLSSLHPNLQIANTTIFHDGTNYYTDSVRISWNNQLALCSFQPLCTFLDTSNAAIIHDNDIGCSSISEIKVNCYLCPVVNFKTWTGSVNDDWEEANNWSPAGIPLDCDSIYIPGLLTNYPKLNAAKSIGSLRMVNGAELDMNGNPLLVKGTTFLNTGYLQGGNTLLLKGNKILIENSSFYTNVKVVGFTDSLWIADAYFNNNLLVEDYTGHLYMEGNYVDQNVSITDNAFRTGTNFINYNYFYGNFSIVANATDPGAITNISQYDNDYMYGDARFEVNAPVIFNIGGGGSIMLSSDVTIKSDFPGYPNITYIGFDVNFAGTDHHLTQLGTAPVILAYPWMNKYQGGNLILDQNVLVTGNFNFGYGKVKTAANKLLIFDNNASINQFGSGSYIWGPAKKIGNSAFTFPIGDSSHWGHCSISAPALSTDAFTAQYFNYNANNDGFNTALHANTIQRMLGREYWKIERTNGNANVHVTLRYDSTLSGPVRTLQDLRVARWNGSQWLDEGVGAIHGTFNLADVHTPANVSGFGPFAFGAYPTRIPVITIGNVDSVICLGQSFKVPFTLDTLMMGNNVFTAQLSDENGSFASPQNIGTKTTNQSDTITATVPILISIKTTSGKLTAANNYKIRIVGSAPADTSVNQAAVKLNDIPSNFYIVGTTPICAGRVTKFFASQKEEGVNYLWSFLAGSTQMTTNADTAFVNPTTTGAFALNLAATNVCGTVNRSMYGIQILPPPPTDTPALNATGRRLYAPTPLPQGATGYRWFKNDTLITGANNSTYYASVAGNYLVKFYNACGNSPSSNSISFAAAALPQSINFSSLPNKFYNDAPFSISANASSGLPVQLNIQSGPGSITGNTYSITGTGTVTIIASQLGDNIYDTAAPVLQTFAVLKATQTISFATIEGQVLGAPPVSLNAASSSGLPITYTIVSGPATLLGNLLYTNNIGTVTVRASQAGNDNFAAATPVDRTFCVGISSLTAVAGPPYICPGQMASYSVNQVNSLTYSWRLSNGTTFPSTSNTVSFALNTPGTYTLLVSASGPCGTPTSNSSLTINVVNAVTPAAVSNMLPANGAAGLALPLSLSWVPANNALTYDVYIWQAETAQPSIPFAANLNTNSYTITGQALTYNRTYKWRVVSKNACLQNDGPVQEFTLKPLPNLVVSQVQIPASAFSGQTVSFSWRVSNVGPGNTSTNQNWTEAVFLSFDTLPVFSLPPNTNPSAWSLLDFPTRTLLIGTKPNVSALDMGQHYTNSINFSLPLHFNMPLYVYVITNYPAGASAPLQMSTADDTARAPQPIAITLSPTPDLRVDTVLTTASTFSGSTINVSYKVKNYGVLTPPNSNWSDHFYISQSPLFNINNATPLKAKKITGSYYPNATNALANISTQLPADSAYTGNVEVVIPNFIFGTYFIHVVTNASKSLYEGSLANNNVNGKQVQVFLTPTPQLTVSTFNVPLSTASITQPIGVSWNIYNAGFNDNIEKNRGHYMVRGFTTINHCNEASGIYSYRDSLGFGSSYWADRIYLSTDGSGLNTSTALLLKEVAQGDQDAIRNSPDYVIQSSCVVGGGAVNTNTSNVVRPGSNHPVTTNLTIPNHLPEGNYYMYVLTNAAKTVYEYPGTAQVKRSNTTLLIQRPDLTVSSVSVPANSVGGQPLQIQYSVRNNGQGSVFNAARKDKIYISTSPTFDASAQLIATKNTTENIPAGNTVVNAFSYTIPTTVTGVRYFFVHANFDSSFRETQYVNNISSGAITTVSAPVANDLVVSDFIVPDSVITSNNNYFKYTVTNNGAGTISGTWWDSLFVSCNPVHSPATSYFIGRRMHDRSVEPGKTYTDSFQLFIKFAYEFNNCFPATTFSTGYFFVKTNADLGAYEGSNDNNNVTGSGAKVIFNPLVDHVVTNVAGADIATVARPYTLSWTVKNLGYNPPVYYSSWYDAVFFSTDSVYNSNAVFAVNFYETQKLENNQSYSRTKNILPPNIAAGDYYIFVHTDHSSFIHSEKIKANNTNLLRDLNGAAKKIQVIRPLLPDLIDTLLSVPTTVAVGQPLQVVHSMKNAGAGVTYPDKWSTEIWLSNDFIPGNAGDIKIGAKNHVATLQPQQSITDTIATQININTAAGNYILITKVDAANTIAESVDSNNLAFGFVTVYRPNPADLLVEKITLPDTVLLGYSIDTARWIVANNSPNNAAGISIDGLYLSQSPVLDSTAVLMGVKNKNINIAALAKDSVSLSPIVNSVTEGSYHVLVKTDLLNNIVESDKNNNTGLAARRVYVKVKELLLNVTESNSLHNISRHYKLIIPDSLKGATILLTLKTPDSLFVRNEMFIGLGYVPSPSRFDQKFETANYGNQQIVMTSVIDSVYYITVRTATANAAVQIITLHARQLPFEILSVQSSSGGNIGNVTVKISGSLFSNNMTATLSNGTASIPASAVYFTNTTQVFATFNLKGRPLGLYNVILQKPDTSAATLTNGFSIVVANNGGLVTGGGNNTGGSGNGNDPGCDPGAGAGFNSQLVTEIVIPEYVFAGWPFVIQVNFTNPTNFDVPAQTRILYNDRLVPLAFTQAGLDEGKTSLYLVLAETGGPPNIIRAGGTGSVIIYAKAPLSTPGHSIIKFNLK